ncbi:Histone-lysine N-methyltransferase ASHR2 [Forsythia ovata]|uniref:Histone-lysine N-methyltransferase ASHR2 n=1 Tax=Forsythia ovata TaxID=205694 RepID=A0ABD1XDI7_9LAMI
MVSPSNFQTLLSLQGDSISSQNDTTLFLHSIISSLCPPPNHSQFGFSAELSAALLAKDKLNAFGLMEPFAQLKERSVRAYGVYPRASFFNHDCLPNDCRFDYVDSFTGLGNTDIIVRVIHDLPEGREICLSYFPVNLNRCKVEANWSDQEEEEAPMDEDADEDMAQDSETEDCGLAKEDNDFPRAYFFLQYLCNRELLGHVGFLASGGCQSNYCHGVQCLWRLE